jgi:bifunctional non-homologous end joining protein LigD
MISPAVSRLSQRPLPLCPRGHALSTARPSFATRLAVFDLIRGYRAVASAVLCAFDLLELDGEDLRRKPIESRKAALSSLLRRQRSGIVFNQHYRARGETIFRLACQLGCEGIVSKRVGSPYRSGRSKYWLKVKNPKAPAAKRETEESWGR